MRRSRTVALGLLLIGLVPLCAAAAQPGLSAADRSAVRSIHASAASLRPKLVAKANAAVAAVRRDFTACKAKYEGSPQQATIANVLKWMAYMRSIPLGFPQWAAFERGAMARTVTSPLLVRARQTLAWELQQLGGFSRMRFDVCSELELLATTDFSQKALAAWADEIRGGTTKAERRLADKMDARVRASLPALRAAGLTSAQAKLVLDSETGTIFAVIFGLL